MSVLISIICILSVFLIYFSSKTRLSFLKVPKWVNFISQHQRFLFGPSPFQIDPLLQCHLNLGKKVCLKFTQVTYLMCCSHKSCSICAIPFLWSYGDHTVNTTLHKNSRYFSTWRIHVTSIQISTLFVTSLGSLPRKYVEIEAIISLKDTAIYFKPGNCCCHFTMRPVAN